MSNAQRDADFFGTSVASGGSMRQGRMQPTTAAWLPIGNRSIAQQEMPWDCLRCSHPSGPLGCAADPTVPRIHPIHQFRRTTAGEHQPLVQRIPYPLSLRLGITYCHDNGSLQTGP
jgi:hypothetical protein